MDSANQKQSARMGEVPAPRVLGVTALCGWWYLALVWVWGGVEDGAPRLSLRFRTIEIGIRTWLEPTTGPSRRKGGYTTGVKNIYSVPPSRITSLGD